MVQLRDDVVGLDAAILSPPAVWEASGHLEPPSPTRWSTAATATSAGGPTRSTASAPTAARRDLTEARAFNLMFKTHAGPVEDEGHVAYLRPETAQGMFTNFANVLSTTRKKPPFGIAQVGKSFRNEITPQNFVFRTREFEQMEMEYFVPPDEAPEVVRVLARRAHAAGTSTSASRPTSCACATTSPTSSRTTRAARPTSSSSSPGAGTSSRASPTGATTTSRPTPQASGETLDYFDQQTNERYTPYVIEPAAGATRTMMAFLLAAYDEDEVGGETRTVLRLHWRLAPYQVAVLPAVEEGHARAAGPRGAGHASSRTSCATTTSPSPSAGATGARTRSGTPWCVTVDFDSLEDGAVTVRDRDTTEQVRVPIDDLVAELRRRTGEE